ncbi:hypothetical protein ACDA63_07120 [Uliginosibacterium sp. sgz301328]|uniref:hypothetical protein n=1 Tax=Uliginosibacterium sp. sgz301328 TaxID=3243764 RepID=UPI00359EACD9
MKITKMNVEGKLDEQGSAKFAGRIGVSYVIASILGGAAALIYALAKLLEVVRF